MKINEFMRTHYVYDYSNFLAYNSGIALPKYGDYCRFLKTGSGYNLFSVFKFISMEGEWCNIKSVKLKSALDEHRDIDVKGSFLLNVAFNDIIQHSMKFNGIDDYLSLKAGDFIVRIAKTDQMCVHTHNMTYAKLYKVTRTFGSDVFVERYLHGSSELKFTIDTIKDELKYIVYFKGIENESV